MVSEIRDALVETCREILFDVEEGEIGRRTLVELGASSIERADILMETLEKIGVSVPPVRLGEVRGMTVDEIAETFGRWSRE